MLQGCNEREGRSGADGSEDSTLKVLATQFPKVEVHVDIEREACARNCRGCRFGSKDYREVAVLQGADSLRDQCPEPNPR